MKSRLNRLEFERDLWSCGFTLIAGVDEAGRFIFPVSVIV